MTLLDVIDFNEILTVNSMWEKKFGAKVVRLWFENYKKTKINFKKTKKTKMIEYDGF